MKIGLLRVHPYEVIDAIDDCNWSEWACEVEMPDGKIVEGCIQGDGHCFEEDTLRDENGDRFPAELTGRQIQSVPAPEFREEDCGGVLGADGNVCSDADPGL